MPRMRSSVPRIDVGGSTSANRSRSNPASMSAGNGGPPQPGPRVRLKKLTMSQTMRSWCVLYRLSTSSIAR